MQELAVEKHEDRVGVVRRVLNAGSGPYNPDKVHPAFRGGPGEWREVRLDIDARVKPDLVGSVTDMRSVVTDASFDAVWSSHNIEHLRSFEVLAALREFKRVLNPSGFALVTCPDLEAIAEIVIHQGVDDVIYTSPAGPITALDMIFGHSQSIANGNYFMSHNTGFTQRSLTNRALQSGFSRAVVRKGAAFDLWALLLMPATNDADVKAMFGKTDQAFILTF